MIISQTIQAHANAELHPATPGTIQTQDLHNPGRNIDLVSAQKVASKASSPAYIHDFTGNTQGKLSNIVNATLAQNLKLANLTQVGPGRILTLNEAQGVTADMLVGVGGNIVEYAVWGGEATPNSGKGPSDCWLQRFDINCKITLHAIRIHKHTNLHLGHPTTSLTNFPLAGRIIYSSGYNGAAITLKEGKNALLERIYTSGPVGFGVNDAEIPQQFNPGNPHPGDPNWEKLRFDTCEIRGCEFHVHKNFMRFAIGCMNFNMHDGKTVADPGFACLDIQAPFKGPNGGIPAANGMHFTNWKFEGGKLVNDINKPFLASFNFSGCTLKTDDGKIHNLGQHGEVL